MGAGTGQVTARAKRGTIEQYIVTYDSNDQIFIVHREISGPPNMEFQMHDSGLH